MTCPVEAFFLVKRAEICPIGAAAPAQPAFGAAAPSQPAFGGAPAAGFGAAAPGAAAAGFGAAAPGASAAGGFNLGGDGGQQTGRRQPRKFRRPSRKGSRQ